MKPMKFIFIVIANFLMFACNSSRTDLTKENKQSTFIIPAKSPIMDKILLNEIKIIEKDTFIYINSLIQYSDENEYHLSLPIAGFLKKSYKKTGDKVRKGEKMALIEHPEYLDLKRDYLKAKVNFDYFRQTFLRQGELAIDQATSIRKMQVSEKDYKNAEIDLKYLELILNQIGVKADDLSESKLSPYGYLYSPVSGIVSDDFSVSGAYFDNSETAYHILTDSVFCVNFVLDKSTPNNLKLGDILKLQGKGRNNYEGKIITIKDSKNQNELVYTLSITNSNKLQNGISVGIKVPVVLRFMEIPTEAIVDNEWIIWQKSESIFEWVKVEPYKLEQDYLLIYCRKELESAIIVTQGTKELMQIH